MSKTKTLSKVLELKERRKEEIELEFRRIRKAVSVAEALLDGLEKRFSETTDLFRKKQGKGAVSIGDLTTFYDYFHRLQEEITEKRLLLDARRGELERKKGELVVAYQEKRLVEIMKDKVDNRDKRERESLEQKEMDFRHLAGRRQR